MSVAVRDLAKQGMITDTRIDSGERALILQNGYVECYAGSLILAARANPRGLPALEESTLTRLDFPGIKPEERLAAERRCYERGGARVYAK